MIYRLPYLSTYGVSIVVGYFSVKSFDRGWNEYFGGQGIYNIFMNVRKVNQWWQFNNLWVF